MDRLSARYAVIVDSVAKPEHWLGCHFSVSLHKNYGDYYGRSTCVPSKGDILRLFQMMKAEWEAYDSILGRNGNPVTPANLYFEDTTGGMVKLELFGNARLF